MLSMAKLGKSQVQITDYCFWKETKTTFSNFIIIIIETESRQIMRFPLHVCQMLCGNLSAFFVIFGEYIFNDSKIFQFL